MRISKLIIDELKDWTFNVESQSGEQLVVIQDCDFKEIASKIIQKLDLPKVREKVIGKTMITIDESIVLVDNAIRGILIFDEESQEGKDEFLMTIVDKYKEQLKNKIKK